MWGRGPSWAADSIITGPPVIGEYRAAMHPILDTQFDSYHTAPGAHSARPSAPAAAITPRCHVNGRWPGPSQRNSQRTAVAPITVPAPNSIPVA